MVPYNPNRSTAVTSRINCVIEQLLPVIREATESWLQTNFDLPGETPQRDEMIYAGFDNFLSLLSSQTGSRRRRSYGLAESILVDIFEDEETFSSVFASLEQLLESPQSLPEGLAHKVIRVKRALIVARLMSRLEDANSGMRSPRDGAFDEKQSDSLLELTLALEDLEIA